MGKSKIAIVIPLFNEEKTIVSVINSVKEFGTPIIVDDCSTDNSLFFAQKEGVKVLRHKENKGYDEALTTGLIYTKNKKYDYVITYDADGQHPHSALKEIISFLDSGIFIVSGVRKKPQRFSEYLFSLYSFISLGIKDPLCGLKGYNINKVDINYKFSFTPTIGTKLLIKYSKEKKSIKQIEINTLKRIGIPRFGNSIVANLKILKALFYCMFFI